MPADPAIIGLAINGVTKLIDSKYGDKLLNPVGETAKSPEKKRRESDRRRRSGGGGKKKYRRPKRPEREGGRERRHLREPIDVDALAAESLAAHEAEKGRGERESVYKERLEGFRESRRRYADPHGRGDGRGEGREEEGEGDRRRESADVNADR